MSVLRATPKAKDLPNQVRGKGNGQFTEVEVPADYEVVLESFETYDKTDVGKTKGWIFNYSCEYAPGKSVIFDLYLAHTDAGLWKIVEVFDAHGSPSEDGVERDYNPNEILGTMAAAFVDFPRDKAGQPTSTYRGIERVYALPHDDEIEALVPAATPEPVAIPEPGLDNQTAEEPATL